MKNETVKINLCVGYTDKENNTHTEVEIGRLIKAEEFFFYESIWQNYSDTQLRAYIVGCSITKFGTLKMPVSDSVVLSLDSLDSDDLEDELNRFNEQADAPSFYDEKTVKLGHGIEIDGTIYDLVEFGNRITGNDKVRADMLKLSGKTKDAFLAGRKVSKLRQSNGECERIGVLDLGVLGEMPLIDLAGLMEQSEIYDRVYSYEKKKVHKSIGK